ISGIVAISATAASGIGATATSGGVIGATAAMGGAIATAASMPATPPIATSSAGGTISGTTTGRRSATEQPSSDRSQPGFAGRDGRAPGIPRGAPGASLFPLDDKGDAELTLIGTLEAKTSAPGPPENRRCLD